MYTDKHRSGMGSSAFIRGVAGLAAALLAGCKQADTKSCPQDRLTVEYAIDRDTIGIGDPVALVVTAYYPTNGVLELPELGREKDVVQLRREWQAIPRNDGLEQSQVRYTLTSFRLGDHTISTNAIVCRVGDELFATHFPPVVVHVGTSLDEEASSELADIKPPQKLPGRVPPWLWIALGAALAAYAVGLATSRLWRRREAPARAVPSVPPHVAALRALEALRNRGLLERDECEPFYVALSLILRTYLEGRFHLNAPDETTEEIVEEMSRSPELSGTQRNILQEFMRQADMVKFAQGHPDRQAMESAFDTTRRFVEQTKPSGEPTPQTGQQE